MEADKSFVEVRVSPAQFAEIHRLAAAVVEPFDHADYGLADHMVRVHGCERGGRYQLVVDPSLGGAT